MIIANKTRHIIVSIIVENLHEHRWVQALPKFNLEDANATNADGLWREDSNGGRNDGGAPLPEQLDWSNYKSFEK